MSNHPKQPHPRRRRILLIIAGMLAVMLLCVLLFPSIFRVDSLVRTFRYLGLRDKEDYGTVTFDPGLGNVYAAFDGGLIVGNESGATLYDLGGEQKGVIQATLPSPILCSSEALALIYSPGSSSAAAFGPGGTVLLDTPMPGALVDADVSPDGYLCYAAFESGYKTVVTVLNSKLEATFRLSSRSRYLNACAVSKGGSLLAVAALEEEGSVYFSSVTFLSTRDALADLESEDSTAVKVNLGNQIVYDLRFVDEDRLAVIGQENVTFLDADGTVLNQIELDRSTVLDYSVSADGFLLLALYRGAGSEGYELLTLDGAGNEYGREDLRERIVGVSAAGSYAVVLTDRAVEIRSRDLTVQYSSMDTANATRVLARDDGTAILIGTSSAQLYIP